MASYYPYNTAPVTSAHSVNTYHAPYTYPPAHPQTTPQQTVCEVILLKSINIIRKYMKSYPICFCYELVVEIFSVFLMNI